MRRHAVILCVSMFGCAGNQTRELNALENRVHTLEGGSPVAAAPAGEHTQPGSAEQVAELARQLGELTREVAALRRRVGIVEAVGPRGQLGGVLERPKRSGPDPDMVYAVPVTGAPQVGRSDALVTIVKASEFACPFCARVRPTLDQLKKIYGKDLRIVYRSFVVHAGTARVPALAACAAHKQGKWKPMADGIWKHGYHAARDLSRDNMLAIARRVGLKMRRFTRDMDGASCAGSVDSDQALMTKFGVRGTPAFFINGRFLSGARPLAQFQTLIDEELGKAKKKVRAGTRRRDYYRLHVVSPGKLSK